MFTSWGLVIVKCKDDENFNTFISWAKENTRYQVVNYDKYAMLGGGTKSEWKEIKKIFPTIKVIPDLIVPSN